jgi:hypothetical protein
LAWPSYIWLGQLFVFLPVWILSRLVLSLILMSVHFGPTFTLTIFPPAFLGLKDIFFRAIPSCTLFRSAFPKYPGSSLPGRFAR